MKKIKIGVICPSEIAYRRFMPALQKNKNFEYAGVAIADFDEWGGKYTNEMRTSENEKAQKFVENYGGKVFNSYNEIITNEDIESIYLPLPPALHYYWGEKVLNNGKHLFLEKPSTTSANDTKILIKIAKEKQLAIHENYMFIFHDQIRKINDIISSGEIGDIRLFRIAFGFPRRNINDFRYNKTLGGGTLLDNGGYTIKLASMLLGKSAKVVCSNLNYIDDFEVDVFGTATMINDDGLTAQISFGMDNSYKCDLEVWGSKGNLFTNRIFTAPDGFVPKLIKKIGNDAPVEIDLPADNTFLKSLDRFYNCIYNCNIRENNYKEIIHQAEIVDKIK